MRKLFQTPNDIAFTISRLALGIMIIPHGLQKTFGLFGGQGFDQTLSGMGHQFGTVLAFLAIMAEFLGGIGLIVGGFSRVAAFGVAMTMLVAVFAVHLPNGFFMNWMGNQKGEGFEFHLLAIGLASVVMLRGAGAFSLDRWLARLFEQKEEKAHVGKPQLA